jgi:hypothetical protein
MIKDSISAVIEAGCSTLATARLLAWSEQSLRSEVGTDWPKLTAAEQAGQQREISSLRRYCNVHGRRRKMAAFLGFSGPDRLTEMVARRHFGGLANSNTRLPDQAQIGSDGQRHDIVKPEAPNLTS